MPRGRAVRAGNFRPSSAEGAAADAAVATGIASAGVSVGNGIASAGASNGNGIEKGLTSLGAFALVITFVQKLPPEAALKIAFTSLSICGAVIRAAVSCAAAACFATVARPLSEKIAYILANKIPGEVLSDTTSPNTPPSPPRSQGYTNACTASPQDASAKRTPKFVLPHAPPSGTQLYSIR
mmetsp:Transcript_7929/g.26017  ORF Transcript_7929/g.26017 Transcript_7929/m.26017 type:complete len:182 (+) Transcript_7929:143-688(+)